MSYASSYLYKELRLIILLQLMTEMVSYEYALASNNEDNQMHSFLFLNLTRKKPLTDAPYFF